MMSSQHGTMIEVDLRGAARDARSRDFAALLLRAWADKKPPFLYKLRGAGAMGTHLTPSLAQVTSEGASPSATLSLWPIWPWRAPAPVVLFMGRGVESAAGWHPRTWRAQATGLVIVPTRREKVELQVLSRFRRDRVWSLDTGPMEEVVEAALTWMASSKPCPPQMPEGQITAPDPRV